MPQRSFARFTQALPVAAAQRSMLPTWLWLLALGICGLFSLLLGAIHFFFPLLLDFEHAVPKDGPPIKPFRLGPLFVRTRRSDVHGIAWVMNHAASYVLVTIGIVDLLAVRWLANDVAGWLLLWLAGWWALRAASQLYLGRRRSDRWILAGFGWLAVVHAAAAIWATGGHG
jgi:hypothetical protein